MREKVRPVESRSEKDERNKVKLETIKKTVKQKRPSVIGVSALDRYRVIQLVRFRAGFDKILKRYQEWAETYPHWIKNITSIAFTSGHYAGSSSMISQTLRSTTNSTVGSRRLWET